ncbi:hypothetical protein C8J56DRAFT_892409 [Mycena floridula]|nr:hypothetical protein C8J56DRAFT_892409 [Mycena floridula]
MLRQRKACKGRLNRVGNGLNKMNAAIPTALPHDSSYISTSKPPQNVLLLQLILAQKLPDFAHAFVGALWLWKRLSRPALLTADLDVDLKSHIFQLIFTVSFVYASVASLVVALASAFHNLMSEDVKPTPDSPARNANGRPVRANVRPPVGIEHPTLTVMHNARVALPVSPTKLQGPLITDRRRRSSNPTMPSPRPAANETILPNIDSLSSEELDALVARTNQERESRRATSQPVDVSRMSDAELTALMLRVQGDRERKSSSQAPGLRDAPSSKPVPPAPGPPTSFRLPDLGRASQQMPLMQPISHDRYPELENSTKPGNSSRFTGFHGAPLGPPPTMPKATFASPPRISPISIPSHPEGESRSMQPLNLDPQWSSPGFGLQNRSQNPHVSSASQASRQSFGTPDNPWHDEEDPVQTPSPSYRGSGSAAVGTGPAAAMNRMSAAIEKLKSSFPTNGLSARSPSHHHHVQSQAPTATSTASVESPKPQIPSATSTASHDIPNGRIPSAEELFLEHEALGLPVEAEEWEPDTSLNPSIVQILRGGYRALNHIVRRMSEITGKTPGSIIKNWTALGLSKRFNPWPVYEKYLVHNFEQERASLPDDHPYRNVTLAEVLADKKNTIASAFWTNFRDTFAGDPTQYLVTWQQCNSVLVSTSRQTRLRDFSKWLEDLQEVIDHGHSLHAFETYAFTAGRLVNTDSGTAEFVASPGAQGFPEWLKYQPDTLLGQFRTHVFCVEAPRSLVDPIIPHDTTIANNDAGDDGKKSLATTARCKFMAVARRSGFILTAANMPWKSLPAEMAEQGYMMLNYPYGSDVSRPDQGSGTGLGGTSVRTQKALIEACDRKVQDGGLVFHQIKGANMLAGIFPYLTTVEPLGGGPSTEVFLKSDATVTYVKNPPPPIHPKKTAVKVEQIIQYQPETFVQHDTVKLPRRVTRSSSVAPADPSKTAATPVVNLASTKAVHARLVAKPSTIIKPSPPPTKQSTKGVKKTKTKGKRGKGKMVEDAEPAEAEVDGSASRLSAIIESDEEELDEAEHSGGKRGREDDDWLPVAKRSRTSAPVATAEANPSQSQSGLDYMAVYRSSNNMPSTSSSSHQPAADINLSSLSDEQYNNLLNAIAQRRCQMSELAPATNPASALAGPSSDNYLQSHQQERSQSFYGHGSAPGPSHQYHASLSPLLSSHTNPLNVKALVSATKPDMTRVQGKADVDTFNRVIRQTLIVAQPLKGQMDNYERAIDQLATLPHHNSKTALRGAYSDDDDSSDDADGISLQSDEPDGSEVEHQLEYLRYIGGNRIKRVTGLGEVSQDIINKRSKANPQFTLSQQKVSRELMMTMQLGWLNLTPQEVQQEQPEYLQDSFRAPAVLWIWWCINCRQAPASVTHRGP